MHHNVAPSTVSRGNAACAPRESVLEEDAIDISSRKPVLSIIFLSTTSEEVYKVHDDINQQNRGEIRGSLHRFVYLSSIAL